MKKVLFIFALLMVSGIAVIAQTNPIPPSENPNAPVIFFEEMLYDYGIIELGADGNHNFIYKNTGKEPLVLSQVRSSCGCTIPKWSKEPLLSGHQDTIKVTYDTRRLGTFNKTVSVFSNATKANEVVRIQGEVVAKVTEKAEQK